MQLLFVQLWNNAITEGETLCIYLRKFGKFSFWYFQFCSNNVQNYTLFINGIKSNNIFNLNLCISWYTFIYVLQLEFWYANYSEHSRRRRHNLCLLFTECLHSGNYHWIPTKTGRRDLTLVYNINLHIIYHGDFVDCMIKLFRKYFGGIIFDSYNYLLFGFNFAANN